VEAAERPDPHGLRLRAVDREARARDEPPRRVRAHGVEPGRHVVSAALELAQPPAALLEPGRFGAGALRAVAVVAAERGEPLVLARKPLARAVALEGARRRLARERAYRAPVLGRRRGDERGRRGDARDVCGRGPGRRRRAGAQVARRAGERVAPRLDGTRIDREALARRRTRLPLPP
jgi:hypothetical protein